ncbi:protein serine/threonine phosphatase [Cyanobacterium stanieri PCC 7202]|uniref:Protein serine/threonine phosphatase n=1 Tax=Cyanobacterium stanieri (strain ATCC 29140 / PCC 7202) TaxID=292563 RepID=K9YLF4_CYASC|nr:protein serine/threonine phosphatase [Cyanobacterium stanieri PCC 7202]
MSTSPDDLILSQCIFSTHKDATLEIPFGELDDSENISRYALAISYNKDELKPFSCRGDRHYYELLVTDTQPEKQSSLDANLETVVEFDRRSLIEAGIPGLAFPYLTLTEYAPLVPDLLDAWQDELGQEYVIINQRNNWQSLDQYLGENEPKTSHIFNYFQKMARLWKDLSKLKCAQTLLEIKNIGIGDTENLEIKKLYFDDLDNLPHLRQLVETWIMVLEEHDRTEASKPIKTLMEQIEEGKIDNIKNLCDAVDVVYQQAQLDDLLESGEEQEFFIPPDDELDELADQFDFDESDDQEATVINKGEDIDEQPTVVLPMTLLSLTECGMTDIGMKRSHNEDCFAVETKINKRETPQGVLCSGRGFFLVCDGMGGHAGGEVASALAVKTLYQYFNDHWTEELPDEETIQEGILEANRAIYDANIEKGNLGAGRMGTTVVMTLVQDNQVAIAHVGDSRIYRVTRKWGLEQLTIDHSVAQAEIRNGIEPEQAFARPDAYQLTQALGPRKREFVHPEVNFFEVKEDTLFLMCSDGLSDNDLLENNWQSVLLPLLSSKANLQEGASHLLELANQINGHDNITCVLARIKVQPNLEQKNPLLS